VGNPPDFVSIGIGDDAAVLVPERGMVEVITTDSLVEGVHFRREWTAPGALGHKALAVNLSDLAAMGARPRACLLSLALPDTYPVDDFDALVDGLVSLADAVGAPLVGGNLTRSPGPVVVDVTAIGVARPRRILRRQGARAGDELYVTGSIGGAATGLAALEAGLAAGDAGLLDDCLHRYHQPAPRYRAGMLAARSGAKPAAIDLSDGLADGARRLADAAGVGVERYAVAIPVHPGAVAWGNRTGSDPVLTALTGGEDYELLFAVSPRQRNKLLAALRRLRDLPVTRIGRLAGEGHWLNRGGERQPLPGGFVHF
jgi:thiamine-monophosphate kinase